LIWRDMVAPSEYLLQYYIRNESLNGLRRRLTSNL
jgi:hypothetical protein